MLWSTPSSALEGNLADRDDDTDAREDVERLDEGLGGSTEGEEADEFAGDDKEGYGWVANEFAREVGGAHAGGGGKPFRSV